VPPLPAVFGSHLTQLAVAFLLGAGAAVGLASWLGEKEGQLSSRAQASLDALDEHKDDILGAIGTLVILARSVILPNGQWVEVINGGQLVWLVLAVGLGIGVGRIGKGLKKKLENAGS